MPCIGWYWLVLTLQEQISDRSKGLLRALRYPCGLYRKNLLAIVWKDEVYEWTGGVVGGQRNKCSLLSIKRCGYQYENPIYLTDLKQLLSAKVFTKARKTSLRFLPVLIVAAKIEWGNSGWNLEPYNQVTSRVRGTVQSLRQVGSAPWWQSK